MRENTEQQTPEATTQAPGQPATEHAATTGQDADKAQAEGQPAAKAGKLRSPRKSADLANDATYDVNQPYCLLRQRYPGLRFWKTSPVANSGSSPLSRAPSCQGK